MNDLIEFFCVNELWWVEPFSQAQYDVYALSRLVI